MKEKLFDLDCLAEELKMACEKADAVCQAVCESLGGYNAAPVCVSAQSSYALSEVVSDYLYIMQDKIDELKRKTAELRSHYETVESEAQA